MDKYFGNAYRGDPGIPHVGPEMFENIWIGTHIFAIWGWNFPYMWQIANEHNYHDLAMLYEQYHVKRARQKKQPHVSLWNKQDKAVRDSYYINWPVYFP